MTHGLHLAERQPVSQEMRLLPVRPFGCPPSGVDQHAEPADTEDLRCHLERFGSRPAVTGSSGAAFLRTLEEYELTGRGGGHFPVARKWQSALRAGGGGILVANAAESEPESAKDHVLLTTVPHLVLDGLSCAAEVLGSTACVLWIHEQSYAARRAMATAVAERRASGLVELPIKQVAAPNHYLSGESSAILRTLSGGPTLPSFARRPASAAGHLGRPAVVHNVETLARIGLLARTGHLLRPPTTLVTVSTQASRTVLELDEDVTVGAAVRNGGCGDIEMQAVLVGGYGGSWLPWATASNIALRQPAFHEQGASLGAGVLIPLAVTECGIARTAEIAAFLAGASARQCGPCRNGLPTLAERLKAMAHGHCGSDGVNELKALAQLVDGRGACRHPDGAVRMITSALRTFAADVTRHVRGMSCESAPRRGPVRGGR